MCGGPTARWVRFTMSSPASRDQRRSSASKNVSASQRGTIFGASKGLT
jgi:hypothetical protein